MVRRSALSLPCLPRARGSPALPISVTTGNRQLEVTYAGSAPGMVAGVIQVNVRLSPGTPPTTQFPGVPNLFFPIELHVGDVKSGMSCVWGAAAVAPRRRSRGQPG